MEGKNPVKEIDLLHAVRWSAAAWDEVSQRTIERCWIKSTLIGPYQGPKNRPDSWVESILPPGGVVHQEHVDVVDESLQLVERLQDMGVVKEAMNINRFLNFEEEQVVDTDEDLIDRIASEYGYNQPEAVDDDVVEEIAQISHPEASDALQKLRLYEEQQEVAEASIVKIFMRYERLIKHRKCQEGNRAPQSTLDQWLNPQHH